MVILVKHRLPHVLIGFSARAHVAAISQDVENALACLLLRAALQPAVPSTAMEVYRGDLRLGTFFRRGEFRHSNGIASIM